MLLEPRHRFKIQQIEEILDSDRPIKLSPPSFKQVAKAHDIVQSLAELNESIYGVNTGFGKLAQVKISAQALADFQVNALRSHACAIGEPLPPQIVRRLLLLRILSLAKGASGISPQIIQRHLQYFNGFWIPRIPSQGSVGASGDIAPLAHLGLTFIGEGEFLVRGREIPASAVLRKNHWNPIRLQPKEALSLFNGTQFSLALGLEARRQLAHLIPWMEWAAVLTLEGHQATSRVFDPRLHELKDHPHQQEVAARFYRLLKGSKHMEGHRYCSQVQDSYSFRCIPQVLGPVYSILEKADELLEGEINSVSDNPLVLLSTKEILPAGHFHAHSVSLACDLIGIAVATLGNLSERRIDQLVGPGTTRIKAFLADRPGVDSGLMILQTAVASLPSENKTLAHPASSDTIPTNGNQEDHVSMAPWAARKALQMIANFRKIVAAEIIAGVRGCVMESTRTGLPYSAPMENLLSFLAEEVPSIFLAGDRHFGEDWRQVERLIETNEAPEA